MFLGVLLITAVQDGIPSETTVPIGYAQNKDGKFVGYSFQISKNIKQTNTKSTLETPKTTSENQNHVHEKDTDQIILTSGNTAAVGSAMFLRYLLPFELISVLLLAAVLGAVVLGKKNLGRNTEGETL
ncbi:NADH-ubiquinone/plastoquinone oxidoreductase chain 6 [Leptospira interrogans]|nr:NADH-ubiquinone/plastoquinone oxidoreductase chain 6 [Leptospira interrogans]